MYAIRGMNLNGIKLNCTPQHNICLKIISKKRMVYMYTSLYCTFQREMSFVEFENRIFAHNFPGDKQTVPIE